MKHHLPWGLPQGERQVEAVGQHCAMLDLLVYVSNNKAKALSKINLGICGHEIVSHLRCGGRFPLPIEAFRVHAVCNVVTLLKD